MLPPDQIEKLVDKVVERLQRGSLLPQAGAGADGAGRGFEVQPVRAPAYLRGASPGVFDDPDQAVTAAERAFQIWKETRVEVRARCIAGIRKICLDRVEEIAQKAVAETGLGRIGHKVIKNRVA